MASRPLSPAEPAQACGRRGFTLVEVTLALLMAAIILGGLAGVVSNTLAVQRYAGDRHARIEELRFALDRMTRAVQGAERLILPRPDDPRSAQDESVRDPGVLAVSLDPTLDRDLDGVPDADNDGDGAFDEDPPGDLTDDGLPGIALVDDDADGQVDEVHTLSGGPPEDDDDEDDYANEDGWNGIDDDGDGQVDEDAKRDQSGEGLPGEPGVDDDGDGLVDEGDTNDDDEDGLVDEDWVDAVVFRLSGSDLIERVPVPWDEDASGVPDGTDYVEQVVASGVVGFRVVRVAGLAGSAPLVEISLTLAGVEGDPIGFETRVRTGSGR